ncbi:MAG: hypothetical protein PQJ58_10095, partial [Spirochaetales bacterium]|nr:hypothetical protein [Spirochaetales bacterium]
MTSRMIFFDRSIQKWTIFPMIILCNAAILLLFILNESQFGLPVSWNSQFLALLLINFILSAAAFFIPYKEGTSRGVAIFVIFTLQLGCKYIMTKPFSEDIWFEFFLIIILLLEGVLLLSRAEIVFLSTMIMLSVVLTNHNEVFWGVRMPERAYDLKLSLFILTLMFSILSIIIKSAHNYLLKDRENLANQKQIIQKLSASNSELQQYANIAEEKSMINERLKLTREIHDTVG